MVKAFRKMRDKVFIATKGGYAFRDASGSFQLIKPFREAHCSGARPAP